MKQIGPKPAPDRPHIDPDLVPDRLGICCKEEEEEDEEVDPFD